MPHRQITRALYTGDEERLRRALFKMYSGASVKVVAVGGSITFGVGVLDGGTSWVDRLRAWAQTAWPQGNVEVINGAFPAVNSAYMSTCISVHAPADVDLVIIELCTNDMASFTADILSDQRKAFERLVRKLLNYPNRPAVLLLNAYQALNIDRGLEHRYLQNAEAFYFEMATYYGLPLASVKAASYHLMRKGVQGYWTNATQHQRQDDPQLHSYMFWDNMHLSGTSGHRLLFELVAALLVRSSLSLLAVPWQPASEEVLVMGALPPPVFENNFESRRDICLMGDKFKAVATEMQGFEWVNEDKTNARPKWGFTALQPGSAITFTISTLLEHLTPPATSQEPDATASSVGPVATTKSEGPAATSHESAATPTSKGPAAASAQAVSVVLSFLTSYEHMGTAGVTCSGCECEPSRFDGHRPGTTSQLSLHGLSVSQHPQCKITVTVQQESSSGEHKVKLGSLMIGEVPGGDGAAVGLDFGEVVELVGDAFTNSGGRYSSDAVS